MGAVGISLAHAHIPVTQRPQIATTANSNKGIEKHTKHFGNLLLLIQILIVQKIHTRQPQKQTLRFLTTTT
jgi:hypothetical protein